MKNMRSWNYIVSAIVALVGVCVISVNAHFQVTFGNGDPGAGFWPITMGALLILLSILLVIENIKNGEREAQKTFSLTLPANKLVYVMMALTVLFCIVMYFLGLLFATLIFLPVAMRILGARGKAIFIVDIVFVITLYLIFVKLLHTPLPEPIWLR